MDPRTQTSAMPSTQQQSPVGSGRIAAPPRPPPPPPRRSASTDVFLKDFTLVAEAAKRAQMAVLMRDFESVGLS
ncbi:hypothetical protein BT67DRAFT_389066 [Trichocladium antarcticum]|uniref:Uncharacterized protein n=1 Tax=Trichocladium antarcticum TaxID=1450529 RepID=A0AAN6UGA7_9PEZI|nr:hypothetical protein BT67DRAFT_389066 [Trichocladium antarcticum]